MRLELIVRHSYLVEYVRYLMTKRNRWWTSKRRKFDINCEVILICWEIREIEKVWHG